jgi:hypothetical protein
MPPIFQQPLAAGKTNYALNAALTNTVMRDALIYANNVRAVAAKRQGNGVHNLLVDTAMAQTLGLLVQYPAYSFVGAPNTNAKADEVAEVLRLAAKAHRDDLSYAHTSGPAAGADITAGKVSIGPRSVTISGTDSNGNLVVASNQPGVSLNLVTGGNNRVFGVTVVGLVITVQLATGGGGASTSSANTVVAGIAGNAAAKALLASYAVTGTGASLSLAASTSLPDPDTYTSRAAALNQVKAFLNGHAVDTSVHNKLPSGGAPISSPDATDDASSVTLAAELWLDYADHLLNAAVELYGTAP